MSQKTTILPRRTVLRMVGVGIVAGSAPTISMAAPKPAADTHGAIEPLVTEFVFEALVTCEPAVEIGPSSDGIRRYIPITGGTFSGPRIKGVVLAGGADWQLERADGVTEVDALYSIKASDGGVIIVRNRGLLVDRGAYFRTVPQFHAPRGAHDWLNKAVFVGSVIGAPRPGAVVVRVFKVL